MSVENIIRVVRKFVFDKFDKVMKCTVYCSKRLKYSLEYLPKAKIIFEKINECQNS